MPPILKLLNLAQTYRINIPHSLDESSRWACRPSVPRDLRVGRGNGCGHGRRHAGHVLQDQGQGKHVDEDILLKCGRQRDNFHVLFLKNRVQHLYVGVGQVLSTINISTVFQVG